MRKHFLILLLGLSFLFPTLVFAQSNTTLSAVSVQLWPEYDQPSMLVITDFELPANTSLPVGLTFRIPKEGNLIAVANYTADGFLADAKFNGPEARGEWQIFTMTMESNVARFEYYQPLTFNGNQRLFTYLWDASFTVDAFQIRLLEPLDVTSIVTDPILPNASQENEDKYYESNTVKLDYGQQYTLTVDYQKTTNALVANSQGVEPVSPVDANTTGRVSLSNYVPYIIGGLGIIMIVGGIVYYWQSSHASSGKSRRRVRSHPEPTEEETTGPYCSQCGARAKLADRFCRTCGARLRHVE